MNASMKAVHRQVEKLKRERDTAIATVAQPWDKKIARLEYLYNVLGHECFGYRHPEETVEQARLRLRVGLHADGGAA